MSSFSIQAAEVDTETTTNINPNQHFDPLGKPPSEHTLKAIEQDSADLPFDDTRDFNEAAKGFIAEPDTWKVLGPEGNVVWDLHRYDFFRTDKDFPSVHPSLQRVSRLNMKVGLFEVKPGFYQVRGFDLANITFIEGKTGWIVFDPLTAPEPAATAKKLVDKHLGERPVVGVVYSHSHADHWGGVRGIVDEADVRAGKVQIIAPRGFQADNADLTITISRSDLEQTMMGAKTLEAQIADGAAKVEGDTSIIGKLASTLVVFTPDFEFLPGTRRDRGGLEQGPYEVGTLELRGE